METVVALLLIGAALLFLETFLPGLVAGTLGVLCLVTAVILGYVWFGFKTGTLILFLTCLGAVVGVFLWFQYFPQSRIAKRFISTGAAGDTGPDHQHLLHQTGVAHSALRPSGTAIINGKRIDVVTEGAMIERGTPIKVVAVEGVRIVVRAVG